MNTTSASMEHTPGALRRAARPIKSRWRRFMCAATERWISSGRAYDILVLIGMRRSGNHLAINWILGQVPGSAVFYNNIRKTAHPFDVGMREYRVRFPNTRPKIILSYEDLPPSDIMAGPLPAFLSDRVSRHGARVMTGVILRDPYNLFASRMKKWPERFETDAQLEAQQMLFNTHASLALAPEPVFGDAPAIPILYNQLVSDEDYRAKLSKKLNINAGNVGLDDVPVYGHGSSFDGYQTQGSDVRAGVFDRWRAQKDDPRFRAIVADARIQTAAQALFDMGAPD